MQLQIAKIYTSVKKQANTPLFIFGVYLMVAVVATLLKVSIDLRHTEPGYISKVNNFIVYRNSFYHLIHHAGLYGFMPAEQCDQFMYSPTFAMLFAPFALLPKYFGVVIWCVFNSLILFFAIRLLQLDERKKAFIYWFILVDLISTIQNVQANPLVCALFIFTFIAFERKQIALAALFVSISFFIKIFGVMGIALFLLYPGRLKFIGWTVLWFALLFLLPLYIISWKELSNYYQCWYDVMKQIHIQYTDNIYISAMRMLEGVRGMKLSDSARYMIQLGALAVFCIKYLNHKMFDSAQFRLSVLSSIMIWCIIFNHAAESNHYIIAITGVALWYVNGNKYTTDLLLMILAFIFSLTSSNFFPSYLRERYIMPMALKSLPFLFIWLKLEYDLTFSRRVRNNNLAKQTP
jgi:Glycosyltransferase family 87